MGRQTPRHCRKPRRTAQKETYVVPVRGLVLMAGVNAPGRTITLPGGPINIRFSINRLIAVEERYGSLAAAQDAIVLTPATSTRFLMWVGSGSEGTEEQVGDRIDGAPLPELMSELRKAFSEAIGGGDELDPEGEAADPTNEGTAPSLGPTS